MYSSQLNFLEGTPTMGGVLEKAELKMIKANQSNIFL